MAEPKSRRSFSSNEGIAIRVRSTVVVSMLICFIVLLGITPSRVALGEEILLNVPLFNQKDWENKLGYSSTATIASHGCAVTSLAMVYAFYQPGYTNPKKLNDLMKQKGAFISDCAVSWLNLTTIAKGTNPDNVKIEEYEKVNTDLYRTDTNYKLITNARIDRQLRARDPVIAAVSYGNNKTHFIVIVGKDMTGDYIFNEPSGGYTRKLSSTSYQFTRLVFFERQVSLPGTATVLGIAAFLIGDRVQTTQNLNVRTGPGVGYSEITDPDYPRYAPTATLGSVMEGPVSANGYVWWKVQYDQGYAGWSVENGLSKI
jgi:hypothetical protein